MSNHRRIARIRVLNDAMGPTWAERGYGLETGSAGLSVTGDFGQFYCDAVANDAQAAVLAEFLRETDADDWTSLVEMAEDDGIDMVESQQVLLMGKSLDALVSELSEASA